jgi:hypothetical protein
MNAKIVFWHAPSSTYEGDVGNPGSFLYSDLGLDGLQVGPVKVYPLYSTLPPQQQQKIFEPVSCAGFFYDTFSYSNM